LQLNPPLAQAVRPAGDDRSFFISCLPISDSAGPLGDSRVRARGLEWRKQLADSGRWVTIGTDRKNL